MAKLVQARWSLKTNSHHNSRNTIFLIGNAKNGSWADLSGYASVDELRQQIEAVR